MGRVVQKLDPKSDGAARDWVAIYDECSRILYEEINYVQEVRPLPSIAIVSCALCHTFLMPCSAAQSLALCKCFTPLTSTPRSGIRIL